MSVKRPALGSTVIVNLHPQDSPKGDLIDAPATVTGYGDDLDDGTPTLNLAATPNGTGTVLTLNDVPYLGDADAVARLLTPKADNTHPQRAAYSQPDDVDQDDQDDDPGDGYDPGDDGTNPDADADNPVQYPGLAGTTAEKPTPARPRKATKAAAARR